ncbi:hypothetical protein Lupro_09665 [Lutibacter profundi]|uniref:FecR protein domain-containing protein n=1 Tax=Lutibacter profundi TaxID=1622118 RepID=A0A109RNU5_9FLAO|nr:tectonin domain-containing protein [Lutibacter profundi]AMC11517.1 hypothetical protein Lupro_09665 [Lutibacter profundi]
MKLKNKFLATIIAVIVFITSSWTKIGTRVRVTAVKGIVTTQLIKSRFDSKIYCPLERKLNITESRVINSNVRIKTGADSFAQIEYPDHTKIKLSPNTEIILEGNNIFINDGSAWFKVEKQKNGGLIIKTPTCIIGIRGTEFVVKVSKDGSSSLRLIEGQIELSDKYKINTITMNKGMEVNVAKNSSTLITKIFRLTENDKWWTDWPTLVPIAEMPKPNASHSTFKNALGNPCGTDKEFVRSLYQSVLGRDLDVSLTNNGGSHLRKLQNGGHRWRTIWNFFNAPEYKNKQKRHKEFIRDAYQAVLGREPSNYELNDWPKVDRNDILRKFFNSDEYLKIMANCSKTGQKVISSSISGTWNLNQDNGYTGVMTIQPDLNNHFTGNVTWNGSLKGTIDSNVSGNTVNITIDYHNGTIGYYKGTLTQNGTQIINGTVKGNNGVSANWTASKVVTFSSISGAWNLIQSNGYKGIMNIKQNQSGKLSGSVNWGENLTGTIDGGISNNIIEFTLSYSNGINGIYRGVLSKNSIRIDNGTSNSSTGETASWYATKIITSSNKKSIDYVWTINKSGLIYNWNGGIWDYYPGKAQDIGVGANKSVWIIGVEPHRYGSEIYHLVGNKFVKTAGEGVRIDVGPYGNPWGVNNLDHIYKWQNNTWHRMPGTAKDIGIGANGDIWIIGSDAINSNYGIYKWNGTQWVKFPGAAVRIDVGPNGTPWVVNSFDDIYKLSNNRWQKLPGKAKDISVGADGNAWVIGTDSTLGGHSIFKWSGAKWIKVPGSATVISVGGKRQSAY